jgi:guanyl-specific ribonuclease Sa
MSNVTPKFVRTLLTLLAAVLATLGLTFAVSATPYATPQSRVAQPVCGDTSSYDLVPLPDLPPEAAETADLIAAGGPFPYPQDGTVFQNREALLPGCPPAYYHEYTVETPNLPHRGARRIITGDAGEHFYTADHYASFVLVDVTPCGDPTGIEEAALDTLPPEVADTIALVEAGGPFPHPEDGQVYENREGALPRCHYTLYTVETPGVPHRGNRRLIKGSDDFFYTPDRYATFVHITPEG